MGKIQPVAHIGRPAVGKSEGYKLIGNVPDVKLGLTDTARKRIAAIDEAKTELEKRTYKIRMF